MQPFDWRELLLYLLPVIYVFLFDRFFREAMSSFSFYKFSLAEMLLPMWWVLIHGFSSFIFGFSLGLLTLYLTLIILVVHLYDYIRRIDVFSYRRSLHQASRVVFLSFSSMLLGLMLLRIASLWILQGKSPTFSPLLPTWENVDRISFLSAASFLAGLCL